MEHAVWAGWAGGALLVIRLLPQVLHISRTGSASGISRAGVWAWLGNDIGWLAHGIRQDLDPVAASSAALIALDLTLLAQLRTRGSRGDHDRTGIAWALAMSALAASGSPLLAAALVAASFAGTVPHAVRAITEEDLSGVSALTWRLGAADGVLWLAYGTWTGDGAVTLYAALTLAASAIILQQKRSKSPSVTRGEKAISSATDRAEHRKRR